MEWIDSFFSRNPALLLTERDQSAFRNRSVIRYLEAGRVLLYPGSDCEYLPFMLEGNIKVHRTGENGREIILYHIEDGESCILSALGILNETEFPASAVIEKSGNILLIPADLVRLYVDSYPGWRQYIFSLYNKRFNLVLELIDEVLFRKLDVRVARYLLNHADGKDTILNKTHQDLAEELGSSREVISRILKSLRDKGLIEYTRNCITLQNRKELEIISRM